MADSILRVEAELRTTVGLVQLVRFFLRPPIDNVMSAVDAYRLNFCLTPRPLTARGGYPERWGPHRFEHVGDVFLVPPGERLHHRSDGGEQLSVVCELTPMAVERWLGAPVAWSDRRLEASLDLPNPRIRALMTRLAEEAYRPGLASAELAELMAGELAIEVSRFCDGVGEGPVTGGLASWRLRLIDGRLRDLAAPPTLAELASLCSLSIRQLTRGFRASRGCSILDHVSHSRIEGAKRLLAGTDSIKAIAFAVGFGSPSSFAQAFRQATGITPREFRHRIRTPPG